MHSFCVVCGTSDSCVGAAPHSEDEDMPADSALRGLLFTCKVRICLGVHSVAEADVSDFAISPSPRKTKTAGFLSRCVVATRAGVSVSRTHPC